MTPEDATRHIALIRELSRPGGPVTKDAPTASINNPDWRIDGELTPQRRRLFEQLLEDTAARYPDALSEKKALVLAGPPGAGKGSVADRVLGAAKSSFVNVDADEFKAALLRQAIADGSYESWIKPPAVRELEAAGERFFPMEMAALVHEESAELAAAQRVRMMGLGKNLIADTVLGSESSAVELGTQLQRAGYSVHVVDVEVPFEVSEERIVQRWAEAIASAEAGQDPLGGRWVPSAYARPLFDTEHGRARSQDAAALLAQNPAVDRYERHFTSLEEHRSALDSGRRATPTKELDQARLNRGGPLVDAAYTRRATPSAQRLPGSRNDRGRGGAELT